MIRDVDVSEDILQQALMKGVEKPPPEGHANRRAWLAQVIRNSLRMHFRSHGRRHKREALVASQCSAPEDPLELLQQREVASKVREAVDGLKEPYRLTLIRHYWEQCSLREIAADCGVSLRTVETRLRRGRALMRSELARRLGPDSKEWMAALLPLASGWQASAALPHPVSSHPLWHSKTVTHIVLAGILALPILAYLAPSNETAVAVEVNLPSAHRGGSGETESPFTELLRSPFEPPIATGFRNRSGGRVEIAVFDRVSQQALAKVSLRVLNLAAIKDSERLQLKSDSVYREEAAAQEWRILSTETIVTDHNGRGEVAGHADADRVLVVPGAWTQTHSLGLFAGTEKRSSKVQNGAWTPISIALSRRTTRVEGVVLGQDGSPIPNASIHYWFGQNWGRFATPDHVYPVAIDGSFAIGAAGSLDYGFTLVAEAPGQRALYKFFGEANHQQNIRDVVLKMAPAQDIWVQVQDELGYPVAGVDITTHAKIRKGLPTMAQGRYWISQSSAGVTDHHGRLKVIGVLNARTILTTSHPGFEGKISEVGVGKSEVFLSLQSRSRISGYLNSKDGMSLANFQIYFAGFAAKGVTSSQADGAFELCFEDSGFRKRLVAYKPGVGIAWSAGSPRKERFQEHMPPMEISIEVNHSIHGFLQQDARESVVPQGELHCFPWQQASRSTAFVEPWIPQELIEVKPTGEFSISGIPSGRYLLVYELANGSSWKAQTYTNDKAILLSPETFDGVTGQIIVRPLNDGSPIDADSLTVGLLRAPEQGDLASYQQVHRAFSRQEDGRFQSPLIAAGDYVLCLWSRRQQQHFHYPVTVSADRSTYVSPQIPAVISMQIQIKDLAPFTFDDINLRVMTQEGLVVPGLVGGNRVEKALTWYREGDSMVAHGFPNSDGVLVQLRSKVDGSLLMQRALSEAERASGLAQLELR